jgi:rhodanese-related sulfurtransferase
MDTASPRISVVELLRYSGSPRIPYLIDVRRMQAFDADETMIAGATWRDPAAVGDWLRFLPQHRDIAVYCAHGHEVSKNTCAALRTAGLNAYFLEGGIEAWMAAGGPTIQKHASLPIPSAVNRPSKWVTRERPKIDRIACPWLIRRFIDPGAEFLYVPSAEVRAVAEAEQAIPYDVPDVQFSHRGELCSFDAFLADFAIDDPVLAALALIVRGADTGKPGLTPQSPGLLAVSLGLSVNYPDDHAMLEQGMVIYDAFYAWIRSAQAEVHNADLFKKQA